jgi:hypothetical protein
VLTQGGTKGHSSQVGGIFKIFLMCSQDVPNNNLFFYPIWFAHGSISMYISCKKGGHGHGGS